MGDQCEICKKIVYLLKWCKTPNSIALQDQVCGVLKTLVTFKTLLKSNTITLMSEFCR